MTVLPELVKKSKICKYYLRECCRFSDNKCNYIHKYKEEHCYPKIINICELYLGERKVNELKSQCFTKMLSTRLSVKKYNRKLLLQCLKKNFKRYLPVKIKYPILDENGVVIDDGYE